MICQMPVYHAEYLNQIEDRFLKICQEWILLQEHHDNMIIHVPYFQFLFRINHCPIFANGFSSLKQTGAYMHYSANGLLSAGPKPLPETILVCCQLDPWKKTFSDIWIKI